MTSSNYRLSINSLILIKIVLSSICSGLDEPAPDLLT